MRGIYLDFWRSRAGRPAVARQRRSAQRLSTDCITGILLVSNELSIRKQPNDLKADL
jgi:hypothetical protein